MFLHCLQSNSDLKMITNQHLSDIYMAIALMMEAVSTSETSVNLCETARRSIPEDSHLQVE
jgi:hypothetical protein